MYRIYPTIKTCFHQHYKSEMLSRSKIHVCKCTYVCMCETVLTCTFVRPYIMACVHVYGMYMLYGCMCICMCNKGQRKGSVYSSYWRPRKSMRVGCLSTLTKRTPTHQGTITTHTYAHIYCQISRLSYFSPWTQVYTYVDLLGIFKFFISFRYIFISMQPPRVVIVSGMEIKKRSCGISVPGKFSLPDGMENRFSHCYIRNCECRLCLKVVFRFLYFSFIFVTVRMLKTWIILN